MLITPNNEPLLHHLSINVCVNPNSEALDQYINSEGFDCTDQVNMPQETITCATILYVWTVGGQPFIAPPEVGFPIGYDSDTIYYLAHTHYTNPDRIKGVKDYSALRVYHTSKLRQFDAWTVTVGSTIDFRIMIPPKQNNYTIVGHCDTECFKNV